MGEVNAAGMTGYLTFGHGNDAVADIAKRFHGYASFHIVIMMRTALANSASAL